jgi:hypothetical protein
MRDMDEQGRAMGDSRGRISHCRNRNERIVDPVTFNLRIGTPDRDPQPGVLRPGIGRGSAARTDGLADPGGLADAARSGDVEQRGAAWRGGDASGGS